MTRELLKVRGARHHNLKNIDIDIPKKKLVVISGLSGSGKSTLAFDTIYAEGQRRYVESLSAYARQFLEMMDKPDVDTIEGLSPAISIQQKTSSRNPRSTVGTTTEIYDYMRLLYARIGEPHCTKCGRKISTQSVENICDSVLQAFDGEQVMVLAPIVRRKKGTHEKLFGQIKKDGHSRVRIDGKIFLLSEKIPTLDKQKWHDVDIVVDRLVAGRQEKSRLFESVETALKAAKGDVAVAAKKEMLFSQNNACPHCGISVGGMEPRTFSFNSPFGMCQKCNGIGVMLEFDPDRIFPEKDETILDNLAEVWGNRSGIWELEEMLKSFAGICKFSLSTPVKKLTKEAMDMILYGKGAEEMEDMFDYDGEPITIFQTGIIPEMHRMFTRTGSENKKEWLKKFMRESQCSVCDGRKLRPESLAVSVGKKGIMDVCAMSIMQALDFFSNLKLTRVQRFIARDILKEITERLEFLRNVGLEYLSIDRRSSTLSGGEAQRIRLATQIGSNLTGVLYVLDEPTIGLHQRDNAKLIRTLSKLRDLGNTVIVVEHDEEVIRSSDWLIDMGPGAGIQGGRIVFEGTVAKILRDRDSITGMYMRDKSIITLRDKTRRHAGDLCITGCSENNLKGIDAKFPLGLFTVVTGVSGSGKSTLVNGTLLEGIRARMYTSTRRAGAHKKITGMAHVDNIIEIDQSPIGRTPRSNPATYVGVFTPIRELYANVEESRRRGYTLGQFSFNVASGRCFACEGDGVRRIEMQFLSDVYVRCDECKGKRFHAETLAITYKGKNIADILDMTVYEALGFFENVPAIRRKLQTLSDVGLDYIKLGQSSTTLSGGEAQRIKLATELSKRSSGRTVYVLDEPTTGLHFADVQKLLDVLNRLANSGNTIIVIEHNMDVIRNADWIIDLGPEGGEEGGRIIAEGTPEDIAKSPGSYTGKYLKPLIK